jgi:hypothetical protein
VQFAAQPVDGQNLTGNRIISAGDGDGNDPEEVPRLLNPVAQEDKGVARRTKGASPGLPISCPTAEAMGGY